MTRAGKIVKRYGNHTGRRFAAVELPDGSRVDVLTRGTKDGRVPNAWGEAYPADETRALHIYAKAAAMRATANPAKRSRRAKSSRGSNAHAKRSRRNAPLGVSGAAARVGARGVLMSREVVDLTYRHAQSAGVKPYRHEFGPGVGMYALPDGSILLRHSDPRRRLWEDRLVGDDA